MSIADFHDRWIERYDVFQQRALPLKFTREHRRAIELKRTAL
jgi:hypothetical protein